MSEQNKGGIVMAILFIARLHRIPDIRSQSITLKLLVIPRPSLRGGQCRKCTADD